MRLCRTNAVLLGCLAATAGGVIAQQGPATRRDAADFFRGSRVGLAQLPQQGTDGLPTPVDDGRGWLEANQNPDGSWGNVLQVTVSGAVLETLSTLDSCTSTVDDGAAWLVGQLAQNDDFFARQIGGLATANAYEAAAYVRALDLLSRKNPPEPNSSLPNWPEGGWGFEQNFETDCQTTALALLALDRTGFNGGFTATDVQVADGDTNFHRWKIAFDAVKARIRITVSGSTVRLRMAQGRMPDQFDPFFELPPGGPYLIVFPDSGLGFDAGVNYISVENPVSMAPTATYTMTASYETPDFDTRTLVEPLDYLRQSQNVDGGWGLQRGLDTDFYTTLHVELALLRYVGYEFATEVASGTTYIKSQQLIDGSFGIDGTPVPYMTALGALNLVRVETPSFSAETDDAITALTAQQDVDGSWMQEAYDTALAMLAVLEHGLPPTVDAGGDQTVTDDGDCSENVTLAGSASDNGSIVSYSWAEDCGQIGTGSSPVVTVAVGTHLIVLTATDDEGLTASDRVFVHVDGQDQDVDGFRECVDDCDDTNNQVWGTPGEASGLVFPTKQLLSWTAPAELGGTGVVYDVLRNADPSDFEVGSICLETNDGSDTEATVDAPAAGITYYYLVRAENDCPLGQGTLGLGSSSEERFGIPCD